MSYAILEISQTAFDDIKARVDALNKEHNGLYRNMIGPNGSILMDQLAVAPERVQTAQKRCCEVCENPIACVNGRTICDLTSEFIAPVAVDVGNKMLAKERGQ